MLSRYQQSSRLHFETDLVKNYFCVFFCKKTSTTGLFQFFLQSYLLMKMKTRKKRFLDISLDNNLYETIEIMHNKSKS